MKSLGYKDGGFKFSERNEPRKVYQNKSNFIPDTLRFNKL